jgi:integrase
MPNLTKRVVDSFLPALKDIIHFDEEIKGFGVRILPSGQKTYLVQYRDGGRTHRVKIGRHGTLTVDEARKRAQELLGNVAKGKNPAAELREHRRAPRISDVCERFYTEHVLLRCKPRTQVEYRRAIDLFIKPALGTFKVVDVQRADIAKFHHDHRTRPYQANRTLGVLSKMFNLTEVWGLRPDGSNPCRHVAKYPEQKRESFLDLGQIGYLGRTLQLCLDEGSESPQVVAAFYLLMFTGCRLSEIQFAKWSYIDGRHLCLPDSKTGKRRIALSKDALAVLEMLPRATDNDYLIFGEVDGQPITDLQRPWRRIRKKAGFPHLRIHDLRHSFASNAIQQGVDLFTVGKLLGHSQIQTTMRYSHIADDPLHKAMNTVGNAMRKTMIQANAAPELGSNVISLKPRKA